MRGWATECDQCHKIQVDATGYVSNYPPTDAPSGWWTVYQVTREVRTDGQIEKQGQYRTVCSSTCATEFFRQQVMADVKAGTA